HTRSAGFCRPAVQRRGQEHHSEAQRRRQARSPVDPRSQLSILLPHQTPLVYRAIDAWYVRVADIRDKLVRANDEVNWIPEAVGQNRFGNWLRDANDWNISRNRFWGSCLPIWVSETDPKDLICVGSIAELELLSGVRVTDLHKDVVDEVIIRKGEKTYRRTP